MKTLTTTHSAVETLLPKFELFAALVCRGDKHMQEDLIQEMALSVLEYGKEATLSFFISRACWSARKCLRGARTRQTKSLVYETIWSTIDRELDLQEA